MPPRVQEWVISRQIIKLHQTVSFLVTLIWSVVTSLPYKIDPYLKILKEKNEPDQGKQAWPRSLSWRRSTPGIDGRRVWSTTGSRDGYVDCFPAPITLFSSLNMCWRGTIVFITPLFLQCELRLFDEFWLQWVAGTTIFKDENDEWILHC